MVDMQIIATALVVEVGAVYVGYLANHTADIARSWADGRAWLAARAAGARTARDTVRRYVTAAARGAGRVLRAGVLAVLCAVLRAHGRHRLLAPSSAPSAALAAPQTDRFVQTGGSR